MKLFGLTLGRNPLAGLVERAVAKTLSAVPSSGYFGRLFGIIREPFTGAWQRNMETDSRECLLANGAAFSCITRIANDIGKLPPRLVEEDEFGIWGPVTRNSPYWPVLIKPNRYQNRIQFFTYWILSKLITGNTYVLKERDSRGIVIALYVLDPNRVQVLVSDDGGVYYSLGKDVLSQVGDASVTVPASEVIHDLMNPLFHPLVGVSPLYASGAAATQANRIQTNSSKFFENMSRPSGIITAPGEISDDRAMKMKELWDSSFAGANAGRVAVLAGGLSYLPMTINPVDAQLVAQLQWTAADIAGTFGVPLYKIGAGPVPTSNNVEALNQQYYSDCLQIHIESIELCLDEGLELTTVPGHTYGTEFDLDVLLRMDSATALDSLAKGVGAGIVSPNEARFRRNLPPVPGGQSPMLQQQNYSLEALGKRDARPDPFATAPSPAPAPTSGSATNATDQQAAKAFMVELQKQLEAEHA